MISKLTRGAKRKCAAQLLEGCFRRAHRVYLYSKLLVIPLSLFELPLREGNVSVPIVNDPLLRSNVAQTANVLRKLTFE